MLLLLLLIIIIMMTITTHLLHDLHFTNCQLHEMSHSLLCPLCLKKHLEAWTLVDWPTDK